MTKDDRDILETLQQELDFIEKGGYGRSVRTPWIPTSAFQGSLTCLNYGYPYKAHPCSECLLINFVPTKDCGEEVPCHHIVLNGVGDTIATLETEDNQQKLEANLKVWLRARIGQLEEERTDQPSELQGV